MRGVKWFLAALLLCSCLLGVTIPVYSAHVDCLGCHNLHGGGGDALLIELTTEATCNTCHGLLNPYGFPEALVHDPIGYGVGVQGHITCRECHDSHNNVGSNVKLVGYEYDPETLLGDATGTTLPVTPPAIRVETSAEPAPDPDNPLNSTYRSVTFTSSNDFNIDGTFPGPGICQICHDPNHNIGADCKGCHPHNTGFKPKGCTDINCHDGNGSGALAISNASSHSLDAT